MRRALLAVPLVALALTVATSAFARDPVAAEALFRAGREAAVRGDHATACARFAESQRLDPAPGTLLNLAECKEHLGLHASAWQHLHEAADRLVGDARLVVVKRKMDAIEPLLSRLTITLAPGAPPGVTLTRDGEPFGDAGLGVALPVDRGPHVLVVSARGHEPRQITVELGVSESKTVAVEPGPLSPVAVAVVVAAAPVPEAAPPSRGLRNAGFVVGGLGVASLAAGVATGVMTLQRKALLGPDHCTNKVCDPIGVQAASEGKTLSLASTATFIAGLAGIGAGVAMVVTGSRAGVTTVVAPAVAPGLAGVVARGTF